MLHASMRLQALLSPFLFPVLRLIHIRSIPPPIEAARPILKNHLRESLCCKPINKGHCSYHCFRLLDVVAPISNAHSSGSGSSSKSRGHAKQWVRRETPVSFLSASSGRAKAFDQAPISAAAAAVAAVAGSLGTLHPVFCHFLHTTFHWDRTMPRSGLETAGRARAAVSASACQEDSAAGVPPGTAVAKEAKNADAEGLPDLVQPSAEAVAAAASRAAAAVAAGVTLQLTPAEEDLFSLLNKCIEEQQLNIGKFKCCSQSWFCSCCC